MQKQASEGVLGVRKRPMEKLLADASDQEAIRVRFGHHEYAVTVTE